MTSPEEKSYIDELDKSLYSRNAPDVRTKRRLRISEDEENAPKAWQKGPEDQTEPVVLNEEYKENKMSFFTKLFIFSAIFCMIAIGVGAYLFWNGSNLISADNIEIMVNGPVSVPGGEVVSFDVTAKNNNNVDLQGVDLSVAFPAGTVDPLDQGKTLSSYRKLMGDIPRGGSLTETVRAVIFGEENLVKQISVTLTYGVKGSTAVFTKNKTYDVLLSSSPIGLSVTSFKEINSGQEFELKMALKSNSKEILKNVLLKGSYPFGYKFVSSSFPVLTDNATWKIGDLPPGAGRTITLRGSLSGEDGEARIFRFTVGAANAKDDRIIGTQYLSVEQPVTIQKPFVSLRISIGGDKTDNDYIGRFGQSTTIDIDWFNNLPDAVTNMQIGAKISGSAYDKGTVTPTAGYFDSSNNVINWNRQTNPELASPAGGAEGKVSFQIAPRNFDPSGGLVNPIITVNATVSGKRAQEDGVPQDVSLAVTRNIKVSSEPSLSGRIVQSTGPFTNSGPIPPRVDQTTTYTVLWSIDNSVNAISETEVKATLPTYVKWLGVTDPKSENIIYDENSGLVTWYVGSVEANNVRRSRRKEVSFQVAFTPSLTQTGQQPVLVNQADLVTKDDFTGVRLVSHQAPLTTRYSTDPGFRQGNETVVR